MEGCGALGTVLSLLKRADLGCRPQRGENGVSSGMVSRELGGADGVTGTGSRTGEGIVTGTGVGKDRHPRLGNADGVTGTGSRCLGNPTLGNPQLCGHDDAKQSGLLHPREQTSPWTAPAACTLVTQECSTFLPR